MKLHMMFATKSLSETTSLLVLSLLRVRLHSSDTPKPLPRGSHVKHWGNGMLFLYFSLFVISYTENNFYRCCSIFICMIEVMHSRNFSHLRIKDWKNDFFSWSWQNCFILSYMIHACSFTSNKQIRNVSIYILSNVK